MNRSAPPSILNPNPNSSLNSGGNWSGLRSTATSLERLYRRPAGVSNEPSIEERILSIYSSWNVADPRCQFQHFFYNVVSPDQVHLYARPTHISQDDPRWQRAKRNNPDPSRLVPTLAVGFEDLSKRSIVQQNQARIHLSKLQEISDRLNDLTKRHDLRTVSRLHKVKQDQTRLSNRLMNLMTNLMSLIVNQRNSLNSSSLINKSNTNPTSLNAGTMMINTNSLNIPSNSNNLSNNINSSSSSNNNNNPGNSNSISSNSGGGIIGGHNTVTEREEELMERIIKLKMILEEDIGRTKVGELWARLNQLKSTINSSSSTSLTTTAGLVTAGGVGGGGASINGGELSSKWNVIDEREIKKVLEVLMNQQRGIDHLILILKKFKLEVTVMRKSFDLESSLKPIDW
ncbi:nucleoporin complex subunit 54-domain-containing protein [Phakopsora pachyrhizi]|nr:nucleoporin complex subunit 54-domain-containing protein [Phakopsora pachyrhizi]